MARLGDDRVTPANIRAMESGDTLRDDTVTGLELRCGTKRKSWRLWYRTRGGIERRPTIGAWPALNIEAARKAARDILVRVARGEDPSAEWQDYRSAPAVADLWPLYLAWLKVNRAKGTCSEYERQVKSLLMPHELWRMRVRDVHLPDIEAFIADVRGRRFTAGHKPKSTVATHAGTRVAAVLSGMFKFAELRTGQPPWRARNTNPVKGVLRPTGRKRRRYANAVELAAIGRALTELDPIYPREVALLLVLLFTGARTGEFASALWADLAPDKSSLVLREHKTARTQGDKTVIIPVPARAVLARLAQRPIDPSGRIFGDIGARKSPIDCLWRQVRKRVGYHDLQIRDLRRTFASLVYNSEADEAVNKRVIGDLLGHTNEATTGVYTVLFAETRQRAAEGAAQRAATLLAGSPVVGATGDGQSAFRARTMVRRITDRSTKGACTHRVFKSRTASRAG